MKKITETNGGSPGEVFRLEDFLPHRLSVAAESVSRLIGRAFLDAADMGMPEWRLLAAIGRFGVLSPTAAGERTAMDKVKISRSAASLVSRGLVRQNQDPRDGRGRQLRLTKKGSAVYAEIAPTAEAIETMLMAGLSRAEWAALHKALGKLADHAQLVLDGV